MYYNWFGIRFKAVDAAHRCLGPVVRISPNHLSFGAATSFKEIYGHKAKIVKDVFYSNLAGDTPNMADEVIPHQHARKRKYLAAIFAAKNVNTFEPRIQEMTVKLLDCLKIKAQGGKVAAMDAYTSRPDGTFDVRPWFNMFTFDVISYLLWSESFGFLDRGNDLTTAETEQGQKTTMNAMDSFQKTVWFSVWCAHLPPWAYTAVQTLTKASKYSKAGDDFTNMARHMINRRIANPPSQPDFFSFLPLEVDEKGRPAMPMWEIIAECSVMLNAGNDTTQTTLVNNILMLATHPHIQEKLRDILRESIPENERPVTSYAKLSQIPFLRAVLDETFRLVTPQKFGLPRRTVETSVIDGHFIMPGVTVSGPLSELHLSPELFTKPLEWIPERWMPENPDFTDEERHNLRDFVMPFTTGTRACIGRNLAYMEVSIAMAALVLSFEWKMPDGPLENHFGQFERITSNPTKLFVKPVALA